MSTPPMDIKISKFAQTMVAISKLGNTCKSMVFWTILGSTCCTRFEQEGKLTQGHWWKNDLCNQMFFTC
jgi:hypothetical protein